MTGFKYLRRLSKGVYELDHRLTPEVRAMLCAMSSRMPAGGIEARYREVVEAVAESVHDARFPSLDVVPWKEKSTDRRAEFFPEAEDRLCEYPIPEKVKGFFDQFVANYGHASIMELTGSPSIYTEGISWWAAYLLFDSPLCSGQEFSTRAVRHKDWPMARECVEVRPWSDEVEAEYQARIDAAMTLTAAEDAKVFLTLGKIAGEDRRPDPTLQRLHDDWMDLFEIEVEAWKDKLSDPEVRKELGIADKEPFRPALDRARWAIPGTIATGCAHTGHLRERSRAIRDGISIARNSPAPAVMQTWEAIKDGYRQALPGMADLGLREALYDPSKDRLPGHLRVSTAEPGDEVELELVVVGNEDEMRDVGPTKREAGAKVYVDPYWNAYAQVRISFRCTLAVARDWHRHRTAYPWRLNVVMTGGDQNSLVLHPAYAPLTEGTSDECDRLFESSSYHFLEALNNDDVYRAMLCLPLGAQVKMDCTMGLRDAIYMLELRSEVVGSCFEYKAQATEALQQLRTAIAESNDLGFEVLDLLGLE